MFTGHSKGRSLQQLAKEHKATRFLGHFSVPSTAKPALRSMLNHLGINEATLYPDLDALARHLAPHQS
jgi:hypothetical protein